MAKQPIFIHSLFRTGSTYIWNKFRQNDKYYCYYEPLHQAFSGLTLENIEYMMTKDFKIVHHPQIGGYYLKEYIPLLKQTHTGVPYFKKEFSFDQFCFIKKNPELKKYIDTLIAASGNNTPVLQFNRSAFRIKWFKENYPDSVNIYMVRKPHDQWQSYHELYKRTGYAEFFLMDLLTVGVNKNEDAFLPLSLIIPVVSYRCNEYEHERDFYRIALKCYSEEEKYFIFFYIWLMAMFKTIAHADVILNINLLSKNPSYQKKFIEILNSYGIKDLDFKDADVSEYSEYGLSEKKFKTIETHVQSLFTGSLVDDYIECFFQKISPEDLSYFGFRQESFKQKKIKSLPDIKTETIEKLNRMLMLYADENLQNLKETKELKHQVRQKDLLVNEKVKEIVLKDGESRKKDQEIYKKNDEIQKTNLQLKQKEDQLKQKEDQLKQKEDIISQKNQLILLRDQEIENKNQQLKKRTKEMELKNRNLRRRDQLILQKNQELEDKYSQLTEKSHQISKLEYQVQQILNSYTYRIGRVAIFPLKTAKKVARSLSHGLAEFPRNISRSKDLYFGKHEKKINLSSDLRANFGRHRSGWSYVVQNLKELHNPDGILFDSFIERTFCWHPVGIKPHLQPWIGIIHVPPKIPEWFHHEQSNEMVFRSEVWQKSFPYCRGLFTLSNYHRKNLETKLTVPISNLIFPTEIPALKWSWKKFEANREKKIVQVGWWLRKLHAIHQLPKTDYVKIFLNVKHKSIPGLMKKERSILTKEGTFKDSMYNTVQTITFLPNKEYDRLLCENIVFIYLYDASANNTVIECIVRNTPILVNPIEPVREYLGEDYPFYYHSYEEAVNKLTDFDLIYKTHKFLINHPIKKKLAIKHFLNSLANSQIYRSLTIGNSQEKSKSER